VGLSVLRVERPDGRVEPVWEAYRARWSVQRAALAEAGPESLVLWHQPALAPGRDSALDGVELREAWHARNLLPGGGGTPTAFVFTAPVKAELEASNPTLHRVPESVGLLSSGSRAEALYLNDLPADVGNTGRYEAGKKFIRLKGGRADFAAQNGLSPDQAGTGGSGLMPSGMTPLWFTPLSFTKLRYSF